MSRKNVRTIKRIANKGLKETKKFVTSPAVREVAYKVAINVLSKAVLAAI